MEASPRALVLMCSECKIEKPRGGYNSRNWRLLGPCQLCHRAALVRDRSTIEGYFRFHLDRLVHSQKGASVQLTVQDLVKMWEDQKGLCALTGRPMTHEYNPAGGRYPDSVTVDLIGADGGYCQSNVRLVCFQVQRMKGELPLSDFVTVCRSVATAAGQLATVDPASPPLRERWSDMV
eukprot:jgi/Mesvir1/13926/Mv16047-RA.1